MTHWWRTRQLKQKLTGVPTERKWYVLMRLCSMYSILLTDWSFLHLFYSTSQEDDVHPKNKTTFGPDVQIFPRVREHLWRPQGRELRNTDIVKYRERRTLSLGDDVLHWWKKIQSGCSTAFSIGQQYLSIPATRFPSLEGVFSTAGDIVTAHGLSFILIMGIN